MDFSALSTLVFDLDGVVWRGETAISGAAANIEALRAAGKQILFATNNSSRPPAFFAEKLEKMGILAAPDDVFTSSTVAALYLSRRFPGGFSAYVVGEEGIAAALEIAQGRVFGPDEEPETTDCVVAGIDRSFSYARLRRAQQLILKGAHFVATNRDATFPIENGVAPGAGSIVAAIETASGTSPVVCGKPEPMVLALIAQKFGLEMTQMAMIGDRLDTDIACAHRAGAKALFVATGVTPLETALAATGELAPHACFDDLAGLAAALIQAGLPPSSNRAVQTRLEEGGSPA